MQKKQQIYKIYSRKRLDFDFLNNPKFKNVKRRAKKAIPIIFVILIGLLIGHIIWNLVNPIFTDLCKEEAKSIATRITNEETTKIMKEYDYDNFFTIEKDADGNIQMISANVLNINQVTSDIALNIQNSLDGEDNNKIYISLGSVSGIKLLAGSGPQLEVKISTIGNIETNLESEFIAQGVNQTLHRVYLEVNTNVGILIPNSTITESICNQVLILENVIVGEIPDSYYNFDGDDSESTSLELIE